MRKDTNPKRFEVDKIPKYGSFFRGFCVVSPADHLSDLASHSVSFFTEKLGIEPRKLEFGIHENDADLVRAVSEVNVKTCIDPSSQSIYRHSYGEEGIWGRDVKIGMKTTDGEGIRNLGTLVLVYDKSSILGVELALGNNSVIIHSRGLDHFLDCYATETELDGISRSLRIKLKDAVIVSMALFSEGLKPNVSSNQTRLLVSYMKIIAFCSLVSGTKQNELSAYIKQFETGILPFNTAGLTDEIMSWVDEYQDKLRRTEARNLCKSDLLVISKLGEFATS